MGVNVGNDDRFLRYEKRGGCIVAVFKSPFSGQGEVVLQKETLKTRLKNLKGQGCPYGQTEKALNGFP